jgi:hypothetical protein
MTQDKHIAEARRLYALARFNHVASSSDAWEFLPVQTRNAWIRVAGGSTFIDETQPPKVKDRKWLERLLTEMSVL